MSCPLCGYEFELTEPAPGAPVDAIPSDGDATLCIACSGLSVFTAGATQLRVPTAEERAEFLKDPIATITMKALIQARTTSSDWPSGPGSPSAA